MSVEFLGHKKQLLDFIVSAICERTDDEEGIIADIFCGTGTVSSEFKYLGFKVLANDHLRWCATFAKARLLVSEEPDFSGISAAVDGFEQRLLTATPYDHTLAYLNSLDPIEGFFYWNYSPRSQEVSGFSRMYFSPENAGRIDAIRSQIKLWENRLNEPEEALLIKDLIEAANAVSNTAGTYGAYLKHWKPRSQQPLELERSKIVPGGIDHEVYNHDANKIAASISAPIVYADPPYTKRQYAAYYHIPETIAAGDEPEISGRTGLRPWQDKASDYCYKDKAGSALEDLVSTLDCKHFFLSYSEDGQIEHSEIIEILSRYGHVDCLETDYPRYKSNAKRHKGRVVVERLYHLVRR